MVQDGLDKDQIDPKLKHYEWLSHTTGKVWQTPLLRAVKKPKLKKGRRRLRGTIKQANHASRKLRQKVDA